MSFGPKQSIPKPLRILAAGMITEVEGEEINKDKSSEEMNEGIEQRSGVGVTDSVDDILNKYTKTITGELKSALLEGFQTLGDVLQKVVPHQKNNNTGNPVDFSHATHSGNNTTKVVGQQVFGMHGGGFASNTDRKAVDQQSRNDRRSRKRDRSYDGSSNCSSRVRSRSRHRGGGHRDRSYSRDSSRHSRSRSRSHGSRRTRSRSRRKSSTPTPHRDHVPSVYSKQSTTSKSKHSKTVPPNDDQVSIIAPDALTLDKSQEFWTSQAAGYTETTKVYGPEIDSSVAGACKLFWHGTLTDDQLESLKTAGLVPANCSHLKVLRVNPEIFSATTPHVRSSDVSIQNIQNMHIALTSCMLQAVCSLNDDSLGDSARDKLNQALQLSGRMNTMLNTHRREGFKFSIPVEKKAIVDLPVQPESEHLFGDDLEDRLSAIKKKNQLKKEFTQKSTPAVPSKKTVPSNNKKTTYSGNEKAPQKSQEEYQQGSRWKGKFKDNEKDRKKSYQPRKRSSGQGQGHRSKR